MESKIKIAKEMVRLNPPMSDEDTVSLMLSYHAQFETKLGEWINVDQSLPKNHSIVEAKNENTGHVGKHIVFTDGVFNHEFASQSSEASVMVEFKNVTHWRYENQL